MAKGKKTGGRPFPKGNNLNPLGAGAHNKELKRLRRLSREQVADIGSLVIEKREDDLRKICKDANETVLRKWFATVALKALQTGDSKHFNVALDRIIGKATEYKEITGAGGDPLLPRTEESREEALKTALGLLSTLDAIGSDKP